MSQTINAKVRTLTGTSTQWASFTDTLLSGEIGYDSTQKKFKVGDGTTQWASLPWAGDAASVEVIDTLVSTSTNSALSANQGRVLKTLVDSKLDTTTAASTYASQTQLAAKLDATTAASTYATKTELAAKADASSIPTVNNATITFTQGGASKGSFTLNQSGNATIALEGGSGGSVTIDTTIPATPLDTNVPSTKLLKTQLDTKANSTDIPTVNNATITFTQGGTSKGSFTLNQAGNATIALDAGGGSSVTIDTTIPATPLDTNVPSTKLLSTQLATKQDTLTAGDGIQIQSGVISATNTSYITKYRRYDLGASGLTIDNDIDTQNVTVAWTPDQDPAPSFTNAYNKTMSNWPHTLQGWPFSYVIGTGCSFMQSGGFVSGKKYFVAIHCIVPEGSTVETESSSVTYSENFWRYHFIENYESFVYYVKCNGLQIDKAYAVDIDALVEAGSITLKPTYAENLTYLTNMFKELNLHPGQDYIGQGSGDPVITCTRDGVATTLTYPATSLSVRGGDTLTIQRATAQFTASYQELKPDNSSEHTLDLNNVDRLLFIGDSYTEGMYYIKNKAWVCQFNELSDYNCEAYGWGGYTLATLKEKLDADAPRFNVLKPSEIKATRCVIMSCANDNRYQATRTAYGENYDAMLTKCESMGMKPIIASEFQDARKQISEWTGESMAQKHNTEYWAVEPVSSWLNPTLTDGRYFSQSHPGVRLGGTILEQMLAYSKARLPRPESSIKVYRPRTSSTAQSILNVATKWDLLQSWHEIGIAHSAITNNAEWDNLNSIAQGNLGHGENSEYGQLQKGNDITLVGCSQYLVRAILPTNAQNCSALYLDQEDATAYSVWDGTNWQPATTEEDLHEFIVGDTLTIIVTSAKINPPVIRWTGNHVSKPFSPKIPFRSGTEALTETSAALIKPSISAAITNYTGCPQSLTDVATVTTSNYLEITIPNTFTGLPGTVIDGTLRLAVRWNPELDTTAVTSDSLDRRRLVLKAYSSITAEEAWSACGHYDVGMAWQLVEIPIFTQMSAIRIYAETDAIEIAYASVVKH